MNPATKYEVIHRHKDKFTITEMCKFFNVSRSGYYEFIKRTDRPEKDADLAALIRYCQERVNMTYGHRRIKIWLLRETGL